MECSELASSLALCLQLGVDRGAVALQCCGPDAVERPSLEAMDGRMVDTQAPRYADLQDPS